MELQILYEDNHLIAVNKPGGLLVQGDHTRDITLPELVKEDIKVRHNKPGAVFLGLVHRIDRPVSGVVLFGKTSKATTRINDAFRKNRIKKTYLAIVEHEPPKASDSLKAELLKNKKLNKSFIPVKGKQQGKLSELSYRWIASSDGLHLLQVNPVTGRHHQIRVMLSNIGCPIKGDLKYGSGKSNPDGNICLHARGLELIHPVKKEPLRIEAAPPDHDPWLQFGDFL